MVFEKALSRKAFGSEEDEASLEKPVSDVNGAREHIGKNRPRSTKARLQGLVRRPKLDWLGRLLATKPKGKTQRNKASMGKILNLLR